MARELEKIQDIIIQDVNAQPELAAANTGSRRSLLRLFTYVVASSVLILEQTMDLFRIENEALVNKSTATTHAWIASKILEFQYSATSPQIIQLINLVPTYPVINVSLRIVSRVSVITTAANKVRVKVAKNEPPEPLTLQEVDALQSYITTIGTAGITYIVFSSNSDKVYIDATIFYDGQYSSTIQDTVKAAINTHLSQLPFDGELKVLDLEIAIRNVIGVSDVVMNNLKVRSDSTAFASGTFLIQNKTAISRKFPSIAGYIEEETTQGFTFLDSLIFSAV